MKVRPAIGIMLYCPTGETKDVFTEEKYSALAKRFVESGIAVETVPYSDERDADYREDLRRLDGLLVWVNPIERGNDRTVLDGLLTELADAGIFISALPETIQKIGTKRILFDTRDTEFGSDVELYATFDDFKERFPDSLKSGRTRVLKRFRGNGGEGVFKVRKESDKAVLVLHAKRGAIEERVEDDRFFESFREYFNDGAPLLDQEWNDNLANGMVRCYMSQKRVAGFGYQEINALFPLHDGPVTPGKRFYFTEACPLFADLRKLMEECWVNSLLEVTGLEANKLPVIWDADFFINSMHPNTHGRYVLCEINVSSVSPFPESAIEFIVEEVASILSPS